jgi:hypothetical protein
VPSELADFSSKGITKYVPIYYSCLYYGKGYEAGRR